MTRLEAVELIKGFIKDELPKEQWYQYIAKDIKAIVFYGSRAKETNRPDSDVDILIIVPLETEKKYTTGEYNITYEGWEINIVLRSIEKMRTIAADGNDKFQAEVFRGSEVVWESDDEVRNLIDAIIHGQNGQ